MAQEPVGVGVAARGPLGWKVAGIAALSEYVRDPGTGELSHSHLGTGSIFVPFLMVLTKSLLPHLALWLKAELSDLAFFCPVCRQSKAQAPSCLHISETGSGQNPALSTLPFLPHKGTLRPPLVSHLWHKRYLNSAARLRYQP